MRVRVFATLRDLLGIKELQLDVAEGQTAGDVLRELVRRHPALGSKLWNDTGDGLSGQVTVLLNGRAIAYLTGLDTPVAQGDELALFPPVGGG